MLNPEQDTYKAITDMAFQAQRESGAQEKSAKVRVLKDLYDIVAVLPEHSEKRVRYDTAISSLEKELGI